MGEVGWVLSLGFLVLLVLGMPIAFALGVTAVAALWVADIDLVVLAQRMIAGTQTFSLLAVPCFILAGELMQVGGLSKRLVAVARAFVRHLTGGLGMVTVLSATFFAAISGSAPATTAAIGGLMIPEMEKSGYRRDFSAALATAAGPIGQMIPPSIPMIIWGVLAEESISRLFLAGILPGILIAAGLMGVCYVAARRAGLQRESRRSTARELASAIYDGRWALGAPVLILGGIYGGIFTPTEAAAVGVVYGLVVGLLFYRELRLSDLPGIVIRSMRTSAMVLFIIAAASAFGWLVAIEQLPEQAAALLLSVSDNPVVILLMVNLLLLLIGAVMDNIAAMILLGGVLTSLGAEIGMDPTQLGALVVINFAIGMATPPFGYALFVGAAVSKLGVEAVSKALWPFLLVEIGVLMLVTFVPDVTLAIPRWFLG